MGTNKNRIKVSRIIHVIHAAKDIAACRARYLDMFGGLIFAEGYFEGEDRDMALLYVADFMMEPMAPRDPVREDKSFARYLQRFGEGFHSFEIKVEDGPAASAALKEAGCKLATDYGVFFFVRAESTGGVLVEACETPMPNDPHDRPNWRPELLSGHRSGIVCLDHIVCATSDMRAVLRFFTELLDGDIVSDGHVERPQPARRVVIRLADSHIAFLQPDDPAAGALGATIQAKSSGIHSLVWRVEDETKTEQFFADKGLRLTREGCASVGFAIEPADFLDARHEFVSSESAGQSAIRP